MKNKVTALLLATTMAISGTAGAFTVSAAEAADSGTLKLSVTTGDGSTSDDKIPTPWYNRLLATNLMFRSLFLADSNLTNAQPDLADSYEISDDKLTYTITLKDGLKWSDGEELTAEDVKFSIETALKAATINSIYTSAFKNISDMSVDGNTITLTLSSPYASMIDVLAQFAILPEHCLKDADPLKLDDRQGQLRGPQRADMGFGYGRKRHPENRQGHRLPVSHDRASAGCLHQLQPRCWSGGHSPGAVPSPAPGQHRTVRPLCTERLGHRPGGQIRAETGTGWRGGSGGLHQGDRDAHHLCRTGRPCRHRPQGCGRFHRADRRLLQEAEPRRTAGHPQRVQVIKERKIQKELFIMEFITLNNGVKMPAEGIGTFLLTPDKAETAVLSALKVLQIRFHQEKSMMLYMIWESS